jgi:hypothetical protein
MDDDKKPVDMDALDQLHAAATPGEWSGGLHALHENEDIERYGAPYVQLANGGWEIIGFFPLSDVKQCAALHNAYPAIAAEIRALRQERDTLQEDYRQLNEIRKDLMRRCERMKSLEGLSLDEIAARQLQREATLRAEITAAKGLLARIHGDGGHHTEEVGFVASVADADAKVVAMCAERDTLNAEAARLREALEEADRHLSSMGWTVNRVQSALAGTTTTAEWLAARDAEQRRIGAEVALTKAALSMYDTEAAEEYTNQVVQWLRDRAASLRAGKGE